MGLALPRLIKAAEELGQEDVRVYLNGWHQKWVLWKRRLDSPLADYPSADADSIMNNCVDLKGVSQELEKLKKVATQNSPAASPQQIAYDALTKFEVAWQLMKRTEKQKQASGQLKIRFQTLLSEFEKARDAVLSSLYEEIEDKFTTYYRVLHPHEGSAFEACMQHEGAGLKFVVDFYGRGKFPPIALHSEGHQDSMGLCLYLALMEKLTGGKVGLTILDDVVMSIDAEHRRPVCQLLLSEFKDRQFIITTHDKHWAKQLRNTDVIPAENYLTFRQWTVEQGPRWNEEDHWRDIREDAEKGDIPRAAAGLRRELEEFFDDVCDVLAAPVPYSGDAKYDKGDLVQAGISQFGKFLRKVRTAEGSWGHQDKLVEIENLER